MPKSEIQVIVHLFFGDDFQPMRYTGNDDEENFILSVILILRHKCIVLKKNKIFMLVLNNQNQLVSLGERDIDLRSHYSSFLLR